MRLVLRVRSDAAWPAGLSAPAHDEHPWARLFRFTLLMADSAAPCLCWMGDCGAAAPGAALGWEQVNFVMSTV